MYQMPNPFEFAPPFTLDEQQFFEAIEPKPDQDSMTADELLPLLEALTKHL